MILKVRYLTHLRRNWINAFYILLFGCLYYAIDFRLEYPILLTCFFMLVILVFPNLYMHLNHYSFCKHRIIHLNADHMLFDPAYLGKTRIDLNDIKDILCVMAVPRGIRLGNKFPFQDDFYVRIETIQGEVVYLSSLYHNELHTVLQEQYPSVLIRYKSVFYPNIHPSILE